MSATISVTFPLLYITPPESGIATAGFSSDMRPKRRLLSGLCKLHAATTLRRLSGLRVGDTVRRRELVMDPARVAAFRALVLWTLRLTHGCDSRPVCVGRKGRRLPDP